MTAGPGSADRAGLQDLPADSADVQPLPQTADALCDGQAVARLLAARHLGRQPAVLLRYGDTGGRILARPAEGSIGHAYLKRYLGSAIRADQIDWMADQITASVRTADVIGLRSDLLGPNMTDDILTCADDQVLSRLAERYPLRAYETASLRPDDARRLAETRRAMELLRLPARAVLTDAWVHFALAENGFLSALLRHAPSVSVCTSLLSRPVLGRMAALMKGRLRVFECPANPVHEAGWAGDHAFLWDRWVALTGGLKPAYDGEPLLISAGIWTKVLAPVWAGRGGVAIDMGSVMDCLALQPTRPAVLATRYDDPKAVPAELSLDAQMARSERLEDYL